MASLPNPIQVSGKHNAIYESYYKQIDPKGAGMIEAMVAAKFLKKSGLSDVVLSRIWDLSDPNGKGFLDKPGFFVSLKLVALAQSGQTINMANIYAETQNPPKVGELPKPVPQRIQPAPVPQGDWSIKIIDRLKYEQLFESLKPVNGLIAGNKVKGVLLESKLPMEILGKIWDLADQDKDGNLDKHEFIVAMHLVYQTLDKRSVPDILPPELQKSQKGGPPPPHPPPPHIQQQQQQQHVMPRAPSGGDGFSDAGFVANFPKDIAPPPVPPLPVAVPPPLRPVQPIVAQPTSTYMPLISTEPAASDWVVIPSELKRYEIIFRDSDRDLDGLVSGMEVKNVFLQSGVPQNCLAHIWALCDTNQSGKLTLEQFALAMWMVERKKLDIEPPQVLAPNMVPPTMRAVLPGVDLTPQMEPKPTYSNPELEMISKEIEELAKERRVLETDIAQKEADIRIKSGEVRSLQSELDTLAATLKQLENQKGEAQKRLDDLKNQVTKIREQCQKQEETIGEQESELNSKRSELQKLKDEESSLEKEYTSNQKELEGLTKKLQDTQLEISQVRSMVTQLLEAQRQMTDALLLCKAAVESNDAVLVSDYSLQIQPDFQEARNVLEKNPDSPKKDAFNATSNGFASDPFAAPTITKTGFDDNFSSGGFDDGFSGSAFGQAKDPFSGNTADPFGDKKMPAVTPEPGKDDFGSDPFAALHAPTGQGQVLSPNTQKSGPPARPESPSPALPPKKAKQPPPRPAPPRPLQAPNQSDAFGTPPGSGFADFDDFDNKQVSTVFQTNSKPPQQATNTSSSCPPTDFSDDPFKDYRYEDPFNIKDPFADEDEDDVSSEAFFSDDSKKTTDKINKNIFPDKFSPLTTMAASNSPRTTPIGALDNNFANFDSFPSTTKIATTLNTNDKNLNNNNLTADNFFDAFNDNFTSNKFNSTTIAKSSLSSSTSSAFDAFGDAKTTSITAQNSKPAFDDFNDNFEDDFFKLKLNDNNTSKTATENGNFAKFDAFSDQNTLSSTTKISSQKGTEKFAADYSKTDTFDSDMEEALRRSMADK